MSQISRSAEAEKPSGSEETSGGITLAVTDKKHYGAGLSRNEQTERIFRAVENSHTTTIGHMTGRQLTHRPGYEIDIDKILKALAEHGVAVEINAHPWRRWRKPETQRMGGQNAAGIEAPT